MTLQLIMGRVKWFDTNKGYGLIVSTDIEQEIYVNKKAIANTKNKALTEGQHVEFSVIRTAAGLEAADVIGF
ncbi:MAG TPA: cold shock domain-containing protein [Proteus sp.]|uniref:CspB family cold shock protein n=1 Tax=Proteus hauseri ATCC 700826 TaxID=1354271 RepID=A0AAJ3HT40_PROHU|nr:cold shock domain-containing protein [Proteus hauseri]OAT47444.1 CspB family cold shock protein [Proteus hauseri ATCC 700826]QAV24220.1 cold shock domain-containing protein [Proteus hauseri]HCH50797.1 cold shock domain-containing protein [Proteus sp. (in: enterobacteria)]